ncbi:MAG: arginyltransferase [Magnetococcales bacterium]|nr:arginyltransferase [Magnetococcales bacterium]
MDSLHLGLYLTAPHRCGYLEGKTAATLFVEPAQPLDSEIYGQLLARGFRRSGSHVYRPHCTECALCLSARIPVADFKRARSMRRIWNRNSAIQVKGMPQDYYEHHYWLYTRYMAHRHPDGPMADPSPDEYWTFLTAHWSDTIFYEFWMDGRLVMVAVTDVVPTGLSSVYTFFDPTLTRHSLGSFGILWQIEEARRRELEWVYLGYWIPNCDKMRYKKRFQPLEIYQNRTWTLMTDPNDFAIDSNASDSVV